MSMKGEKLNAIRLFSDYEAIKNLILVDESILRFLRSLVVGRGPKIHSGRIFKIVIPRDFHPRVNEIILQLEQCGLLRCDWEEFEKDKKYLEPKLWEYRCVFDALFLTRILNDDSNTKTGFKKVNERNKKIISILREGKEIFLVYKGDKYELPDDKNGYVRFLEFITRLPSKKEGYKLSELEKEFGSKLIGRAREGFSRSILKKLKEFNIPNIHPSNPTQKIIHITEYKLFFMNEG